MPETYEAPTTAEIVEHLEKGGTVESWSLLCGEWVLFKFLPDEMRDCLDINPDDANTPHPGFRLVPLPPRTVTVELPEDVARYVARWYAEREAYTARPEAVALRDAIREALDAL